MKEKYFVVVWQNEEVYIYTSEERAINQVVALTGKEQNKWEWDNGDNDEDGRAVYYMEAIWGEQDVK